MVQQYPGDKDVSLLGDHYKNTICDPVLSLLLLPAEHWSFPMAVTALPASSTLHPTQYPGTIANRFSIACCLKDLLDLAAPWLGLAPAGLRLVSVMGFTPDCEGYFVNQL